jgi:hypothetical protein
MAAPSITIVTTDNIPGDQRAITGRTLVWAGGGSMDEAIANIQKWAADNDYDSVVGLRFTVAYKAEPMLPLFGRLKHFAYGTCLRH